MLVMSASAKAVNLNIHYADGRPPVTLAVADGQKISSSGHDLVITDAGGEHTYSLSEIGKFTYSDHLSANSPVIAPAESVAISFSKGNVSVSGLDEGMCLALYQMSGIRAADAMASSSGVATLTASSPGNYVLVVSSGDGTVMSTFKISIR